MKGKRIGKFWFSPVMPNEARLACEEILVENAALIPNWCNEVRVYWDSDGDEKGSTAYIETKYAYRYASINICPPFLEEEDEDRETRIRHELCHIVSAPVLEYINRIAEILGKKEEVAALIDKESEEKVESMTEDLVYILMQMQHHLEQKIK